MEEQINIDFDVDCRRDAAGSLRAADRTGKCFVGVSTTRKIKAISENGKVDEETAKKLLEMSQRKGKSIILFIALLLLVNNYLLGQWNINDTVIIQKKITWKELKETMRGCFNCCVEYPEFPNENLISNVGLSFIYNIHENIFVRDLSDSLFRSVLSSAKNDTGNCCLLPLLKCIDPNAEIIYQKSCSMSAKKHPHQIYCLQKHINYLFLIYAEIVHFRRVVIQDGQAFENISIVKLGQPVGYSLTQSDIHALYQFYSYAPKSDFIRKRKLKKLGYKWILQFTPRYP
ncbi:MAG: hypothetical protein JNJ58_01310 [Chitinophagaceae bacterium]|nr:hypothetical protein [Chitinophagaceae bacterium]